METWTVYILNCVDRKIYTGCSNNFDDRLNRHQAGKIKFTRARLPVSTLLTITFYDKYKAFAFEKYLKSGSGSIFKKTFSIGGIALAHRSAASREGGLRSTRCTLKQIESNP